MPPSSLGHQQRPSLQQQQFQAAQRTMSPQGQPSQPPQSRNPPSQQTGPSQQRQERPGFPWSVKPLNLLPPSVLNKPGVVPPTSPSPSPFPRYGLALPSTPTPTGDLYLFGGLVREAARNDLYLIQTRDNSATLLQTAGEPPSPRVGHACALVSQVLIVWGGDTKMDGGVQPRRAQEKLDDALYLLNIGTLACPVIICSS